MSKINLPLLTSEVMLHEAFANTSKAQIDSALRHIFQTIADHIANGDEVAIPGFGKFYKFKSSVTDSVKPKFKAAKAFVTSTSENKA